MSDRSSVANPFLLSCDSVCSHDGSTWQTSCARYRRGERLVYFPPMSLHLRILQMQTDLYPISLFSLKYPIHDVVTDTNQSFTRNLANCP